MADKASKYFIKATDSFALSDDFVGSKRFQRFVDIIVEKMAAVILSRYGPSKDDHEVNVRSMKPAEIVPSFLRYQLETRAAAINAKHRNEKISEEDQYEQDHSFLRLPEALAPRPSLLWVTDKVLSVAAEETGEDRYSFLTGVNAISFATDNDDYTEIANYMLCRVCWSYIQSKAIADLEMDESNWYMKLKDVPESDVICLLQQLFYMLIPEIENDAYIFMEKGGFDEEELEGVFSAALRWDTAALIDTKKSLEKKLKEEQNKTIEKAIKIDGLNDKIKSLKAEVKELQATENNSKKAIEESEKAKKKYDDLKKEYDRLVEYVAMLEQQEAEDLQGENDTEQEEESLQEALLSDDEVRSKRVLFVREPKFSKYTMMNQLAEYFPNAKFTNSSITDKERPDVVVLLTRYVKHPTYFAARDSAKVKNIPIIQCNCTNINKIIREIKNGEQAYVAK